MANVFFLICYKQNQAKKVILCLIKKNVRILVLVKAQL